MYQQFASANSKIGVVNGLRGIAILMVVLHHLFIPYAGRNPLHAGQIDPNGIFAAFIADAWLGVNIFFVLSGFVLYLPYRLGRRKIEGLTDFWTFYLHRAKRLLPLYYIIVLVSLALHSQFVIGSRNWYLEFGGLLSTLFIFSPHGFMPPSNIVLWSVGVEVWFSLIFPALVLAIRKWGIERVVLATIVVSAAFMFVGGLIPVEGVGFFRPFSSGIFGACYEFVLGMFACDLYVRWSSSSTPRQFHLHALLAGVSTTAIGLYLMHHQSLLSLIGHVLFAVGIASLLLGFLLAARPLRWLLEIWPLQVLGCMCYSIYAWHGIVMSEMIPPATSMLADTIRLSAPFTFLILMLSVLSYRYIEFGQVRDWKSLFLITNGAPKPSAIPAVSTYHSVLTVQPEQASAES
jgi:peptidoglycan/LPS O-acetylase OafA/YrhL